MRIFWKKVKRMDLSRKMTRQSKRTRQKKKRGNRKVESNDSPEIPDRRMRDTRHPQPSFGAKNKQQK